MMEIINLISTVGFILFAIIGGYYYTREDPLSKQLEEDYRSNYKNNKELRELIRQVELDASDAIDALFEVNPDNSLYEDELPSSQFMSREDKQEYLRSSLWQEKRKERLSIAKHKCESCGNSNGLECHHITYIRLGNENISDLRILCRSCHQKIHDKYGYERGTNYPIKDQYE